MEIWRLFCFRLGRPGDRRTRLSSEPPDRRSSTTLGASTRSSKSPWRRACSSAAFFAFYSELIFHPRACCSCDAGCFPLCSSSPGITETIPLRTFATRWLHEIWFGNPCQEAIHGNRCEQRNANAENHYRHQVVLLKRLLRRTAGACSILVEGTERCVALQHRCNALLPALGSPRDFASLFVRFFSKWLWIDPTNFPRPKPIPKLKQSHFLRLPSSLLERSTVLDCSTESQPTKWKKKRVCNACPTQCCQLWRSGIRLFRKNNTTRNHQNTCSSEWNMLPFPACICDGK